MNNRACINMNNCARIAIDVIGGVDHMQRVYYAGTSETPPPNYRIMQRTHRFCVMQTLWSRMVIGPLDSTRWISYNTRNLFEDKARQS